MKPDIKDLYEHVANLFYAIAGDLGLEPIEMPTLKSIISSYWLPRRMKASDAPLVSGEGHTMLLTLDSLQSEAVSPKHALQDFERFYKTYPEVFSWELRRIILDTAKDIYDQFSRSANRTTSISLLEIQQLLYPRCVMRKLPMT